VEAELKAKYPDSKIEMVKGGGGIFEVKVNGRLIYSKEKVHRFPGKGEITKLIEQGIT
jgi:selT/selW/selH-like putative selenoprotein